MPTAVYSHSFAGVSSWQFISGGNAVGSMDTSDGSLRVLNEGRNKTDDGHWQITSNFLGDFFNLPASSEIIGIYGTTFLGECTDYNVVDACIHGEAGGGPSVQIEFEAGSAWQLIGPQASYTATGQQRNPTQSGSWDVSVSALTLTNSTPVTLRLHHDLDNGNNASAATGLKWLDVAVFVEYSTAAAAPTVKTETDSFDLSDQRFARSTFLREDTMSVTEGPRRVTHTLRDSQDELTLVDSIAQRLAVVYSTEALDILDGYLTIGEQVYTKTETDALVAIDEAIPVRLLLRMAADAATIADEALRARVLVRLSSDVADVADEPAAQFIQLRLLADALTMNDAALRFRTLARLLADVLGVTDAAVAGRHITARLQSTLVTDDAYLTRAVLVRELLDVLGLSDDTDARRVLQRMLDDATALSDSVLRQRIAGILAESSVTVSDQSARFALYERVLEGALGLLDATTVAGLLSATMTDTLSLQDASIARRELVRLAADALALLDAAERRVNRTRAATDAIAALDGALATLERQRSATDVLIVFDSVARLRHVLMLDALALSDELRAQAHRSVLASEALELADQFAAVLGGLTLVEDTIAVADAYAAFSGRLRTLSDPIALADSFAIWRRLLRTVSETAVEVTDQIVTAGLAKLIRTDALTLTDDVRRLRTLLAQSDLDVIDALTADTSTAYMIGDVFSVLDSAVARAERQRRLEDSIVLDEAAARRITRLLSELIALDDGAIASVKGLFSAVLDDAFELLDSVDAVKTVGALIGDAFELFDDYVLPAADVFEQTVSELIALNDAALTRRVLSRMLSEAIALLDSTDLGSQVVERLLADTLGLDSEVLVSLGRRRLLQSAAIVTDAIEAFRAVNRLPGSTLEITDLIELQRILLAAAQDATVLADGSTRQWWARRTQSDALTVGDAFTAWRILSELIAGRTRLGILASAWILDARSSGAIIDARRSPTLGSFN